VVEFSYLGSNILGADSSTVRNVPLSGTAVRYPWAQINLLQLHTRLG